MAAYVIADIEVTDAQLYDTYRAGTAATIEQYGGTFAVRGGAFEVLEGDWNPNRLIVIEFHNMDAAQAWYKSDEYAPLKALRQRAANSRLVMVEGAPA
jgi:uncharacterized protein (DUF1330 family)